eukprot:TRINITY_DN21739_c0_g1_i2.p2 TRINITY_DN21739_c0_g1~~TRINITY_DN21739_c0_g1_i2.p2  ORF type:complete len:155 (-),score=18.26 TRINITY_DN21739_c0_g1_i2:48-512(-)
MIEQWVGGQSCLRMSNVHTIASVMCSFVCYFFFFSSRRRHTRCREVSWARRCVQETGFIYRLARSRNFLNELCIFIGSCAELYDVTSFESSRVMLLLNSAPTFCIFEALDFMQALTLNFSDVFPSFSLFVNDNAEKYARALESDINNEFTSSIS